MAEPTLGFLGERIERIQAELRDLRGVRTDVAHLRAEVSDRHEALATRLDNLEQAMDDLGHSMDARFEQVHQTMAANLQVLLAAIRGDKP